MSRTPFIAGNWKMHKTIAEAEAFIAAPAAARLGDADGVDIAICPPFIALQAMVDSARGSRVAGLRAEHARGRRRARSPARSRRRCSPRSTSHGVVLGHSERRQYFNETDRALQQKVPQALERRPRCRSSASARPRRSASAATPSASCATRCRRGSRRSPTERLPEVVIAYEPIWAIGTGLVATPEQAQEAVAFVRALVEGFDKAAGQAVRILYGGSLKPDNAAGAAGAARHRRRAGRRRVARARRRSPQIVEARAPAMTRPGRSASSILDGWGLAPDGPGQRGLAGRHAGLRRALGASTRTRTLTACGEAVGLPAGPDGQLRGRPPQPRRRRDRQAGPRAHRRGRRGRLAGRERGAARRRCATPSAST